MKAVSQHAREVSQATPEVAQGKTHGQASQSVQGTPQSKGSVTDSSSPQRKATATGLGVGPVFLCVAYLRVSTENQQLGPEAQRAQITDYASRHGLTIVAWYVDIGVGGATPVELRPGLTLAIADARKHRASILVAKRDRLARDAMLSAMIQRSLTKGAQVISADGSGNGDGPADQLMRTILDGMSEYERALIRSRTKAALKAKRARGERAGNVPYGFDASPEGKLSENAQEQAVIDKIRHLAASGLSMRSIVTALDALGVRSRCETPLGLTQVARLLKAS